MKKLLLFPVCVLGLLFFGTECFAAVCQERELGALAIKDSDEYLYQSDSKYSGKVGFECGKDYCGSMEVIFMPAGHYFDGSKVSTNELYYCRTKGNTRWVNWKVEDIADCDGNVCSITDEASVFDGWYIMDKSGGNVGISTGSGAQLLLYTQTNICKCKSIGESKNKCVSTGGDWVNNKCSCDKDKNIKLSADGSLCECINSDYEPNGVNGCKKKQSVINNENNQQRKNACENSGGSWSNNQCVCQSEKNLKAENNVCVCINDTEYVYDQQNKRCNITDEANKQKLCLQDKSVASGAQWDEINKTCVCKDRGYKWNVNGDGVCAMNPVFSQCLNINGANWNDAAEQCYCIVSGKMLSVSEMLPNACDLSDNGGSVISESIVQQNRSRSNILSAVSQIDSVTSGLKVTVWRDIEGNFNTSRLLSDSIAGVVLGTAGGLITSNVVKKNQVENGFEDIQCTVGGQVVAGWGDEFHVGIQ